MNLLYHHSRADVTIRVETGYMIRDDMAQRMIPEVLTLEVRANGKPGSLGHSLIADGGMLKLHVPATDGDPSRSEFWPVERVRSVVIRSVAT